jgi:hypothetical protein
MSTDLSSLDSTVALLSGTDDITEEHAKVAAVAMEALPVEAFQEGAALLTKASTDKTRINKLNILMNKTPEWALACGRRAEWKEKQPK